MDVISSSVDKALTAGGEKVSGAQAELKRGKPPKQKPPKEEKPGKKENKPDKKGDKAGKEKPKKDEVDAAAADSKGKGKGRGKDKGKKEPLTKEEKSKRPCMYFAYDSCRKNPSAHVCTLLMIRVFMVRSASICMTKTTCTKVQSPEQSHQHQQALQPFRQQQQQQSQLQKPRLGKQRRSVGKFSKECPPTLLPHVFSKAVTAIMAAIACLNPVSLSNTNHVPAAIAPVEMSFLLDSGAGRNLMFKKGYAGRME